MQGMAQRPTIFPCRVLECNVSGLRALLLRDLELSRDPENLVLLLKDHRHLTEGTWLIKQLHSHKMKNRKMQSYVRSFIELVKGSDCISCCILTQHREVVGLCSQSTVPQISGSARP